MHSCIYDECIYDACIYYVCISDTCTNDACIYDTSNYDAAFLLQHKQADSKSWIDWSEEAARPWKAFGFLLPIKRDDQPNQDDLYLIASQNIFPFCSNRVHLSCNNCAATALTEK